MVLITKVQLPPEDRLNSLLTGDDKDLKPEDRAELIAEEFKIAIRETMPYAELIEEINGYSVSLIEDPTVTDFNQINKNYALAQSYLTRVNNIYMAAVACENQWKRANRKVKNLIEDRSSELLLTEAVRGLSNAAMQQASVRNTLGKIYRALERSEDELNKASTFVSIIESKKKDLSDVVMNLTRQVKTLSLEMSMSVH